MAFEFPKSQDKPIKRPQNLFSSIIP